MKVQFLYPSRLFQASNNILQESIQLTTVALLPRMWTMQFWQWDTDMMMPQKWITGLWRIHGERLGETRVTLIYSEAWTCAQLRCATRTLYLMTISQTMKSCLESFEWIHLTSSEFSLIYHNLPDGISGINYLDSQEWFRLMCLNNWKG